MERLRGRKGPGGVMRKQGRDLERHPAVDAVGELVDRPEEVGGLPEVLDGQVKEKCLAGFAFPKFLEDGVVVVMAVLERMIEDGGVRGEASDR